MKCAVSQITVLHNLVLKNLLRAVADARVGACSPGKSRITYVHLGGGKRQYELLLQTVEETEIPISQFYRLMQIGQSELF